VAAPNRPSAAEQRAQQEQGQKLQHIAAERSHEVSVYSGSNQRPSPDSTTATTAISGASSSTVTPR
jgi:hypothetical protein